MYRDTNGNEWPTAQAALDEFLAELPELSEEESEQVFQFTRYNLPPEQNLDAIRHGITYAGLDSRFAGDNYPVPELVPTTVVAMARHLNLREHSTWVADVPLTMLHDPRYFDEDGDPTADFDQWMCDNGEQEEVESSPCDEDELFYEIASVDDYDDQPDMASSGSRQHYIDTGRYLTYAEVAEQKAREDNA